VYKDTLTVLQKMPASAAYRVNVEALTNGRLSTVEKVVVCCRCTDPPPTHTIRTATRACAHQRQALQPTLNNPTLNNQLAYAPQNTLSSSLYTHNRPHRGRRAPLAFHISRSRASLPPLLYLPPAD
jgi:hypothetical protein